MNTQWTISVYRQDGIRIPEWTIIRQGDDSLEMLQAMLETKERYKRVRIDWFDA